MVYWTKDMDKFLQKAHKDLSYTEIAKQIGEKFGVEVTRNSAIGRANRIGMRKPKDIKITKKVKVKVEKVKKAEEPKKPVKRGRPNKVPVEYKNYYEEAILNMEHHENSKTTFLNPNAKKIKFTELRSRHCRFPLGDTRDDTLRFCGADIKPGTSTPYCEYCYKIVYVPVSEHRWRKRYDKLK